MALIVAAPSKAQALDIPLSVAGWPQIQDKHFVVVYPSPADEAAARATLRKAEELYDVVTDRIGYSRYKNFWTWDERVKIICLADQESFAAATGAPAWSNAVSISHLSNFHFRAIISYKGQEKFLTSILPHEMSHLILHDFLGEDQPIPRWFDEGVAQLDEAKGDDEYRAIVAKLVRVGKTIPFAQLDNHSEHSSEATQAGIFYAESLYIVDFLIKTYGKDAFRQLCRQLRDGKLFETALKAAYYPSIGSMADLEEKWKAHMLQFIRE